MYRFHKEGWPTLILAIIVSALILWLTYWISPNLAWLGIVISVFLIVIILQFFRNPSREISTKNDDIILAPADGKVVVIEKTFEEEYFKSDRILVSIFMSPTNVHVNRNPISGEIIFEKYHPGKYLVAWHPKSSTLNERTTVVYKSGANEVLIRQIAGALARRIVNYLKTGDRVIQGQEMGFIKFGSRVDIYLPLSAEILVNINQITKGGITHVAKLK